MLNDHPPLNVRNYGLKTVLFVRQQFVGVITIEMADKNFYSKEVIHKVGDKSQASEEDFQSWAILSVTKAPRFSLAFAEGSNPSHATLFVFDHAPLVPAATCMMYRVLRELRRSSELLSSLFPPQDRNQVVLFPDKEPGKTCLERRRSLTTSSASQSHFAETREKTSYCISSTTRLHQLNMSTDAANNDPPLQGGENTSTIREGKSKVGSDSDEETTTSSAKQMNEEADINDRLSVLRREKRLAMNRESARLRRRRKKELINSLEAQVDELVNHKSRLEASNELLARRVQALETELASAQSTITTLLGQAAPPLGNSSAFAQRSLATNDLISRESALLSLLGRHDPPMSPQSGVRSLESLVAGRSNLGFESILQRQALESMAGRLGSGAGGVPPGPFVQHSAISSNTVRGQWLY